ncbi:MAG: hypothetical protein RLZZ490_1595 [Cyanobacteriota bacterium]|jgi:glutamine synthetase
MNFNKARSLETTANELKQQGIEFVRVLFCDNANVIRAKAFHIETLAEQWRSPVSIAVAQQAVPVMYDVVTPGTGLTPVGEAWLVSDWSTLQVLPYAPTHASVLGNMYRHGEPWSLCPRHFLKQAIATVEAQGFTVKAAFENEFYLLKSISEGIVPADNTPFAATLGMDSNYQVIDQISRALIAQGIKVERYYPESGPGQQEISMGYTGALAAADQQIRFRETVRGVALGAGLTASFLPKIFADQAGSGCHLHLSLWQGEQNQIYDPDQPGHLSAIAKAFMAGILAHLPGLMALTVPSVNSYRRLVPHCWSGAFQAWGMDNREAAIRVPSNFEFPSPTHIEVKTVDASANPYLALGAVIYAGLDGIQKALSLPDSVSVDPGSMTPEERQRLNIQALPNNLGMAIACLEKDEVLLAGLGAELAKAFIAVRKAEWDVLQGKSLDEEVNLLLTKY